MGPAFDSIIPPMQELIERQHVFFVATAPSVGGHVNLSPKGYDTFQILDEHAVAYLDLTGSGAETIAHLRENGRITFMFCAFEGKPAIVRLYGNGRVLEPDDDGFAELRAGWDDRRGVRSIIVADIHRTSKSCGFAVPLMDYVSERPTLDEWTGHKSDDQLAAYRADHNTRSIDDLPSLGATG